jgi:hypothetical protein
MRFKDDGGESPMKEALPSEHPLAVCVEDMEHEVAHIYVIMREKIYRFDPVTFMRLIETRSEGCVENDPENAPNLEKVRAATQALRGFVGQN